MTGAPEFSVVIPLFNKEEYIARSLRSVLCQTVPAKEIIVVDDGSTDCGPETVQKIAVSNPTIRLLTQDNRGVSAARNAGIRSASSDLIALLDADDEWDSDHLAVLQDLASDFPAADLVVARHIRQVDDQQIVQKVGLPDGYRGVVDDFIEVYRNGTGLIHSSAVGIRRRVFAVVGEFPEGAIRSEDIYLWLKIALTLRIAFHDRVTVKRHDDGSAAPSRAGVLPYHLEYFLDEQNAQNYWKCQGLKGFLRKSLLINLATAKSQGQGELVKRLLNLSKRLEWDVLLAACAIASAPSFLLRAGRKSQLLLRRSKLPRKSH